MKNSSNCVKAAKAKFLGHLTKVEANKKWEGHFRISSSVSRKLSYNFFAKIEKMLILNFEPTLCLHAVTKYYIIIYFLKGNSISFPKIYTCLYLSLLLTYLLPKM